MRLDGIDELLWGTPLELKLDVGPSTTDELMPSFVLLSLKCCCYAYDSLMLYCDLNFGFFRFRHSFPFLSSTRV